MMEPSLARRVGDAADVLTAFREPPVFSNLEKTATVQSDSRTHVTWHHELVGRSGGWILRSAVLRGLRHLPVGTDEHAGEPDAQQDLANKIRLWFAEPRYAQRVWRQYLSPPFDQVTGTGVLSTLQLNG